MLAINVVMRVRMTLFRYYVVIGISFSDQTADEQDDQDRI